MIRRVAAAVAIVAVCGACSILGEPSAAPLPAASLADEGEATSVFDLDVGQCYNTPTETDVTEVNVVDCDDPHQFEIYALPRHPAGPDEDYPGDEEIGAFADGECLGAAFEDYVASRTSRQSSLPSPSSRAHRRGTSVIASSSVRPSSRARNWRAQLPVLNASV